MLLLTVTQIHSVTNTIHGSISTSTFIFLPFLSFPMTMSKPPSDAMIEYIQQLEYEWFEQSMEPDFFDEMIGFEESMEAE